MLDVNQMFGDFFPFILLFCTFIFVLLLALFWALLSIISMSSTLKDILKVLEEKKDGTNSVSSESRSDRSE